MNLKCRTMVVAGGVAALALGSAAPAWAGHWEVSYHVSLDDAWTFANTSSGSGTPYTEQYTGSLDRTITKEGRWADPNYDPDEDWCGPLRLQL